MGETETHSLEADRMALYLVGKPAGEREKRIYADAMQKLGQELSPAEAALWRSMLASGRRMAWADSGLALVRPSSPLRRRLLVMLAILEASPDFADCFLPRRFPAGRALAVAAAAVRGAFRVAVGVLVVRRARV